MLEERVEEMAERLDAVLAQRDRLLEEVAGLKQSLDRLEIEGQRDGSSLPLDQVTRGLREAIGRLRRELPQT